MLCAKYNLQSERTFQTPCMSLLSKDSFSKFTGYNFGRENALYCTILKLIFLKYTTSCQLLKRREVDIYEINNYQRDTSKDQRVLFFWVEIYEEYNDINYHIISGRFSVCRKVTQSIVVLDKAFGSLITPCLHPGWKIKAQSNLATQRCPKLWLSLHSTLDPSPPPLSSPFSAKSQVFSRPFFSRSQVSQSPPSKATLGILPHTGHFVP